MEDGQSTADASESPSTARPSTANTVTGNSPVPVAEQPAGRGVEKGASVELDQETAISKTAETPDVTVEEIAGKLELIRTQTAPGPESFKKYDALFENGPDPRASSQTARPELADLYAEIYAQYNKPKVKLGPRPKASLDIKRPHTSGSGTQSVARPVSSLPPGLRSSNRKNVEPKRPKSRDASTVPSIAIPPPPPIPTAPEIPLSPMYHPKSPSSIRSLPMNTYSSLHHKSPGASTEKQRLMKALQLRKKQMEARKIREEKQADSTGKTEADKEEQSKDVETSDPGASATAVVGEAPNSADTHTSAGALSKSNGEADAGEQLAPGTDGLNESASEEMPKAGITPTHTESDDIHSAASASSPTSAQTQGSSVAPSTRPSSISEDDTPVPEETKVDAAPVPPIRIDEALNEHEQTSAESTPTVVPETTSPIPQFEVTGQGIDATSSASQDTIQDHVPDKKKKRESVILMSVSEIDDARALRKAKRASMVLPISSEGLHEAQKKVPSKEQQQATAEGNEYRRIPIDPTHLSAENSEAEYLSDDSFMEELQSATVEEAMPMSVSKSPIMPFFPRKPASPEVSVPKRSASQQHPRLGGTPPEQPRKLSGPWMTHSNTDTVVVAKKINVGSGISQRIKALAEKSNRDSSTSLSPVLTPEGGSSTVAQRRSSFFATPPEGNSPNAKSLNRISRASFINVSRSTTPEPKQVQAPPPVAPTTTQTVYNMQQGSQQPESVQVTARIIRDPKPEQPTLTMPTDNSAFELHRSEITIDHQKSTRPPTSSSRHSPIKTEPTSPRPPSSSQSNEPLANLPRSSSESSWRSFGRRLSESKNGGPPRSMSTHSFDISSSDEKPAKKEKKDSRTTKLFKRMSSISSITRKNSAPNILEDIPSVPLPPVREPPSAMQLGDLNIQFPDTLVCPLHAVLRTS